MKLYVIILLFWFSIVVSFGQNREPSMMDIDLDQKKLAERSNYKIDSIQSGFYQKSDSLKNLYKSKLSRLDSSQSTLKGKLDSLISLQLSTKHLAIGNKIDSAQSGVKSKFDSLTARLHTDKIKVALDNINHLRDSTLTSLNKKLQSVKDKSLEKLNALNLPPQIKDKASTVTRAISDFKIPASELNISSVDLKGNMTLSKLDNLNVQSPFGGTGNVGGMESVKGEMTGIKGITDKASGYGKDIQQISKGDYSEVKELPKAAEAKAEELSGMNEIKGQTQVLDEYKGTAGKMQNPDSLKEFAVQEVKQMAVNHFAGKEEQLKQAMEVISKYKTKYSSLNSISEITKRPPNEMQGKPLIERIVPGIALQIQKKGDDLMVDFNPYAGYRFTGTNYSGHRVEPTCGLQHRKTKFNPDARIFGPRAFGEFKLWKGFSPRAEMEVMNTNGSRLSSGHHHLIQEIVNGYGVLLLG